jgi:oligogalacturonide lyase
MGQDLNTGASYPIIPTDSAPPKEWVDKDTGHRVIRLSDEPGSTSLYFHQNPFSLDGSKMFFTSPTGIYEVDLQTRKIDQILAGNTSQFTQGNRGAGISMIVAGRKTGRIYYTKFEDRDHRSIWWIDPATKEQHEIGPLPRNVNLGTVNCDETLLGGAITYLDGRGGSSTRPVTAPRGGRINLYARWSQHLPMALATMNTQTGEIKTFNPSNDWDNHFQFSPTDPTLLMYCHEGPWQLNDRVWTIRTDGSDLFKVHERTMINEIWGHEFWSADGRTIWYQLYYPRTAAAVAGLGSVSYIAGYNLDAKQQTWLLQPEGTSCIHVNVNKDGSQFAGDGGNSAKWIFLFRPTLAQNMAGAQMATGGTPPSAEPEAQHTSFVYDSSHLIQPGYLSAEKLVNMSNHQYALEPNPVFTPDQKWIVFRSNMFGPSYAFMVEIATAK